MTSLSPGHPAGRERSLSLNEEELALVSDGQLFRKKSKITEKIRAQLEMVKQMLDDELKTTGLLYPDRFDRNAVQFVKGEHLEDCPYQYLDYPKHFHGVDKFTFRTLFWWGHHVVVAWILEGQRIKQYKKNLVDRFHAVAGRGVELSTAPTLWEWKRGEGYTVSVSHDRKATIAAVMAERSFIKLMRVVPLDDLLIREGRLDAVVREAFSAMRSVVTVKS
ncbi:hypothetical protein W02_29310 [Nitrospira sp. KM1]|uniref:hypothetical protein n=1 Tax=Nitrospira sp. KM1 TaxID=1936990 RepID=UPI0013A77C13|nr:hypothetical protein [Nitrospira sp. KM1]BCA55791.1 hypothetical protein W02_29310 [Nitrospira sp. KM1]